MAWLRREFMHLLSPTMFWTFVDQCDLLLGASDQGGEWRYVI